MKIHPIARHGRRGLARMSILGTVGLLVAALFVPTATTGADAAWADDPPADPVPTTIALTTDHDTFSVGQTVTLTAVANQMPVGSYSLRIFDQTTGAQLATCSTLTCSKAWAPFNTGAPHTYVAEISTGSSSALFGTTTDVQATSNLVVLSRESWAVSLNSDVTTFVAGQTVTLTATTNQAPNGNPYYLRIFDQTTGATVATCYTAATCTKTWVPFNTGGPNTYIAEVSSGGQNASYGHTSDIQATSNQVTLTRQSWTVSLTSDVTTFVAGQTVTLTATTNQAPNGNPYYLRIFDQTTGATVATCYTAATCTKTWVPFNTGGPNTYIAEVSSGGQNASYGHTSDIQATSNQVTLTRHFWTVSLTSDVTTFAAGQSVTFTATANQVPGTSPYFIRIFDQTTGSELRYCTSTAVCTYTSVPFYTGDPHTYRAEVSSGYAVTTYGATTDIQATSNQVTLTRQTWTVSLSTDVTTFAAGQSVTFTATANQVPGTSPYFIRIFDQTTGSELRYCTSTAVCTYTSVPFYTGDPHTYRAEVSSGYAVTTYGATTDIQATSNQVILARQSWSITLTGSSVTGTGSNPSTVTTLSAVANQNAADTNYNYRIKVVDYTAGTVVASCAASTCHPSVSRPASSPPHSYVAYVASGSTVPLSDVQATSSGYSADNGSGAVLAGEATGGKNAAEKACQCAHADPVNTSTGEFFLSTSDIGIVGVGPGLSIGRAYSTANAATDGPFGYGWSAIFSSALTVVTAGTTADPLPRQVQVTQENGATALFTESAAGLYSAPLRVLATLTHDAETGQWTFVRQSRQLMVFDSTGLLLSVEDLHGNMVNIGRDGSGHVTSLTASGGRSLTLTWTGSHVTGVADSAGRTVSYGYDASGNLTSVTGVDGTAISYGYTSGHYMTTVTKPGGGVTTNTYDSSHRVTKQVDELGRATTFTYGSTSTTTTAPDGSATVETYSNGQLISQTRASGTSLAETTTYGYDSANNVTTVTDPLGKVTSYTYDANGDKLTQTDPLNRTTTWTYDDLGDITSVTDPLGRVTTSTYDAAGDLLTLTSPTNRVQSWTYNPDGTVATWVDGLGKTTHYSYNSAGDQSSSIDADGRSRSIGYNAAGMVTSTTDPAGKVTAMTSDAAARVSTVTDPNGHTTTYGYDADGDRTTVQDALGHTMTSTYDVAGQLTSSTDANGKTTTYTYTAAGYPASKTDPNSHTTGYAYNALGLLTSVTDPAGHVTQLGYDGAARRVSVTRPSGSQSTVAYDVAGQVTASTDANGKTTTYGYDLDGEQTSVTDPLGRVTHTTYTGDGQVRTVTYPDSSVETYTYDALGQTTDFQNADGAHTAYTYDDAGLLTSKTEPGSMTTGYSYNAAGQLAVTTKPDLSTVTTSYDEAGQLTGIHYGATGSTDTSYSYNANGQRISMTDATGTSSYSYDNTGRLISQTNGDGQTIGYGYDDAGQLTSLTYPGNHTVSYGYNSVGRMTSLTDWSGNETDFAWTVDGQLATQADPNGVTQSRSYDAAGHTTGITTATTSATLAVFGYGYDAAGQLTSDSITDPSSSSASTHSYGYDPIGQLTTVNDGTSTSSYAATSAGSLTSSTPGNALAYNSAQELVSLTPSTGPAVAYAYDANGARTSSTVAGTETTDPATTGYSYTPAGSLASVALPATATTPASTLSYTSDGDGLRQSRTQDGTTQQFLWATGGDLPLLLDDGIHSYLYGPSSAPIAQITDSTGTISYLISDLIGSTRVITSSSGDVADTTRYDEYGNASSTGTTTSDIGYSGNWTDPATGLVYLRARDYDPRTAQFTTVDPAVDTTRQPYAYVANDPLLLTDPTGLNFWGDVGNNALAFGAGVLDGVTFGASSAILGAVVPGYNCLIKDNAFFTAGSITGTIVSSIAITALTAGAGGGLAIAGIAGRLAIKEAAGVAVSAAKRLITSGLEKVVTRLGARTAEAGGSSSRGLLARLRGLDWADDTGSVRIPGAGSQLTNSQATQMAERVGYRPTNYFSRGEKVFTNGKTFITQDTTSHTGGLWKMATSVKDLRAGTRLGTYDYDLNWIAP